MYWISLIALAVAAVFDVRSRQIPDAISIALVLVAIGAKLAGLHPVSWSGVVLGFTLAFLLSFALFAIRGLGGGDVKLLSALGAALGASAFLPFLLLTAVFGGVAAWRARRQGETEIAYAPVMLAGLVALLPVVVLAR